jgi:signal transduction histidine kinase
MILTLRYRIFLTLLPLLLLLLVLGGAGVVLLLRLGYSIDEILRENYESVIAMERLNEALERIDSSFQFALAGREQKARKQYSDNWSLYQEALNKEKDNITIHPQEDQLVKKLEELTWKYRKQGKAFYQHPIKDPARNDAYFGHDGLEFTFKDIKKVSGDILELNQKNMRDASDDARQTARTSVLGLGVGLVVAVMLAGLSAWHTVRTILRPLQAVTQSALGISAGNLDQVVPYLAGDELGQLAQAFNTMARYLRDYRQSHTARLLRAQRTSQATIDSFPDPVLVVDAQGSVAMANPAARRILGVVPPADGLAGRMGNPSFPPPAAPWQPPESLRQPLLHAIQDQQPYLADGFDRAVLFPVDGQDHFFLPRLLPIRDPYGNTLGAAILLQDVTRFRLLDEVKSNLVATVSHELKTPLTSIRLALHLLLEEAVGPLTPKQIELLLDARDNAERLLGRVENLLDLTRLERGREQLDIRPEMPSDLLQTAADAIRPRAEDKGVEVVVEIPPDLPPVAVDAPRLEHALGNLLDNAVVYTDRGGRITLSAAQEDGRVTFRVADTGAGIAPEHLPHLFERFFRVPGQTRGTGTGLGLAIVREIVTAHGGSISCESQPGAGTVFRLTLPVWEDVLQPARSASEGGSR